MKVMVIVKATKDSEVGRDAQQRRSSRRWGSTTSSW